jgi:hypothetical protein
MKKENFFIDFIDWFSLLNFMNICANYKHIELLNFISIVLLFKIRDEFNILTFRVD